MLQLGILPRYSNIATGFEIIIKREVGGKREHEKETHGDVGEREEERKRRRKQKPPDPPSHLALGTHSVSLLMIPFPTNGRMTGSLWLISSMQMNGESIHLPNIAYSHPPLSLSLSLIVCRVRERAPLSESGLPSQLCLVLIAIWALAGF